MHRACRMRLIERACTDARNLASTAIELARIVFRRWHAND
jgi:hypothetical protein